MSERAYRACEAYMHILEARIAELEQENHELRRVPEELLDSVSALMVDVPAWRVGGAVQRCSHCKQVCYTYWDEQCTTEYHTFVGKDYCNTCALKILRERAFDKLGQPRKSRTLIVYLRKHVYDAQIAQLLREAYTDAQITEYFGSRWLREK